ncbi:hypothetical protein [Chitinimonas sp.]|uniref:hypothetical protein n=1 Tax=Chitinimonas sp. TaxID=1934313 RepID=UPI002F9286CD
MQKQDTFFRLGTAAVVSLAMFAAVHGLANVSQHHIERTLAQYAAADQVQLAQALAVRHA